MLEKPVSRRKALGTLASLATISIVPSRVLGLGGQTPPSEQLTRAIIGCGGISGSHLGMPGKLLALCDVDSNHLANRMKQVQGKGNKDVKGYADFREIIERKDIDIIHTATPPHWHAYMAIMAAQSGKAIWGEKPMSRTIAEGIAMKKAVQDNNVAFRINTWFRFKSVFYGTGVQAREVKKAIDGGLLGKGPFKVTLNGHTGFNWKFNWSGKNNLPIQQVPAHFDYDTWLGPAPYRPYSAHRTHSTFRGYWDYDGGGLGDMGQHYLDPFQYILGKDNELPVSIEIEAPPQDTDAVTNFDRITYTYADGTQLILDGANKDKDAAIIEGPEGKIFKGFKSDVTGFAEKVKALPDPAPQITDFHQAIREKKKFALNEENGFNSCTLINLGKIAHRLGQNLKFDPANMQFIDNPLANSLIDQPSRPQWDYRKLMV